MSDRLQFGRLSGTVSDVVDAGFYLLPPFEQAAIPVLDGAERPAEWPEIKRRLRAEGIRTMRHRGVILLEPGELERFSSVGLFSGVNHGANELFLLAEWHDELEPFPGRISSDLHDLSEGTPLGLEEWMVDAGALLALGDGDGLNFAATDSDLADRLRSQFKAAARR
jgi:hypothetical protein